MKKKLAIIFVLLLIAVFSITNCSYSDRGRFTTDPEFSNLSRIVSANDLVSKIDPAAVLRFDSTYKHIGGQKFILYGVADAEQHFFVKTNSDNKLKSLYWIQFEAYLADNDYTYDYEDSPLRLNLGDYEFYTDTDVVYFDPNRKRSKGTDGALARQFLAGKGLSLPNNWAYARLVYLTDESRRKELMIIFIDDLLQYGLTAAELKTDGNFTDLWQEFEKEHLNRIRNALTIIPFDEIN